LAGIERELLQLAGKDRLQVLDDPALNAQAVPTDLVDALTPASRLFVRNNGRLPLDIPHEPERWSLTIDGLVAHPRTWTLPELRAAFPFVEEVAVLECAGNGRAGFDPPTDGLQWGLGAVGCSRWGGVRLADVLSAAGLKPGAVYTAHYGPDRGCAGSGAAISRGIPIAKALAPETLLAFSMNGEPLPLLHGGPLRVVVPGYPGSAWQKWLNRLEIRDREHDGAKMTGMDYRLPCRPVTPCDTGGPEIYDVITDMPVRALITSHAEGFRWRPAETIEISGWCWSGHVPVAGVTVSADGGAQWQEARISPGDGRFAWRRFDAALPVAGRPVLLARARDASGRAQPLGQAAWNPRGYCNNGVQRVAGALIPG